MSSTSGHVSKSTPSASKTLYPGLGLGLRHDTQRDYGFYPIGAHGGCYGADTDPLPVREVAMMSVMESLTDKLDWHVKVHDEEIVAKWRNEALAVPNETWWTLAVSAKTTRRGADGHIDLSNDSVDVKIPEGIMSESAFDCCIQELRSKAKHFEKSGIIPTLDATAGVAKSDTLVSEDLHEALQTAFQTLKDAQDDEPDWHPNSGEKVQDLVHPSLYPLVYNRTRAFEDEVVGVKDAIAKWSGRGTIIPGEEEWKPEGAERHRYGVGGTVPPNFWSVNYQWLPANVKFLDDGSVRFTSYINNLHPTKYQEIYRTIENLIEASLPMWDQCLTLAKGYEVREGAGRIGSRFGRPVDADDEIERNWDPSDPMECVDMEVSKEELEDVGWHEDLRGEDEDNDKWKLAEHKWKVLRKPVLRDPVFEDVDYTPAQGMRLNDKFRQSGLQVIVKMASIELTPEKPDFPQGGWHVEGQMNEHICATALYYLDSENTTTSSLSFRMQTSAYLNDDGDFGVGQDSYSWLESCYGTSLGQGNSPCLQNFGTVETKEKRLLAFPNVFQHRVSPFQLVDPTKPGHRRFIALWLVDPHKRIISTANVPPQQMSWWAESLSASEGPTTNLPPEIVNVLRANGAELPAAAGEAKLPEELMEWLHAFVPSEELPMSSEEAIEHRKKLMQERSAHVERSEDAWQQHSYSFCEH